jgi:hypothetical protein
VSNFSYFLICNLSRLGTVITREYGAVRDYCFWGEV